MSHSLLQEWEHHLQLNIHLLPCDDQYDTWYGRDGPCRRIRLYRQLCSRCVGPCCVVVILCDTLCYIQAFMIQLSNTQVGKCWSCNLVPVGQQHHKPFLLMSWSCIHSRFIIKCPGEIYLNICSDKFTNIIYVSVYVLLSWWKRTNIKDWNWWLCTISLRVMQQPLFSIVCFFCILISFKSLVLSK